MKQLLKLYKNFKNFEAKYEISLVSAATSFYIVVALFSLSSLIIQLYNFYHIGKDNFLIASFMDILNPYYYEYFEKLMPVLSLNSFSTFLFISLFWSSSKVINGLNKVSDLIYKEIKKRNGFINRISSFLMFIMLIAVLLIEIVMSYIATSILENYINSIYIFKVIQFIFEMIIIFVVVLLLYIYAPPVKMNFKKAFFGAFVTTSLLYVFSVIIILVIKLYQSINPNYGIISIISLLFLWIYVVNYILVVGIIINYYNFKNFKDLNKLLQK